MFSPTTCRDFLSYENIRLRLFTEEDLSSLPMPALTPEKDEEELQGVIVASFKGVNSGITSDEDSGLGWDGDKNWPFLLSCSNPVAVTMDDVTKSTSSMLSSPEIRRRERNIVRKRSFSNQESMSGTKRPLEDRDTPVFKKARESNTISDENNLNTKECACSTEEESIFDTVDRLSDEPDLIADGSRPYCLPTHLGKHCDLKSISCHTMAALVRGNYSDEIGNLTIIDCRYPYEYNGGHIKGAVNLYRREEIQEFLHQPRDQFVDKNEIIIFHCEFSSERGPKLYRFLRSEDRDLHKDNYPQLQYPEVYLLDGGYKAFFESYKELCEPDNYTPMLHNNHATDLRHFRVKSKSWAAGEKRRQSRQALKF